MTPIDTGANITVQSRMNFVNVNDVVYCMNGTDGYGKLSGTTYTVADANFKPTFAQYFANCMWVAGFSGTDSNKLKKSVSNDPDTFTGGDSDTMTFPESIVSIASTNQALYVFTQTTLNIITASSIKEVSGALYYTAMPLETND